MKWTSVLILASAVLSSSYASEDEATAAFKRAISENTAAAYWASLEKFPDNKLTDSTNAEALSALESGQLIDAERLLQTATSTDATEQQQAERARLTQRLRRQISQLVGERERLIAEQDAHFRRELTATTRKLVQGQYHAANATPDGYIWVGSMPAGASVYIASKDLRRRDYKPVFADSEYVGTTPLALSKKPGNYAVTVVLPKDERFGTQRESSSGRSRRLTNRRTET